MSKLIYPRDIRITGNPSQHGTADLALTLDVNHPEDIHVILTADLLVSLYRQAGEKISELPIRLVETDQ